jgi:hypothetical protein
MFGLLRKNARYFGLGACCGAASTMLKMLWRKSRKNRAMRRHCRRIVKIWVGQVARHVF